MSRCRSSGPSISIFRFATDDLKIEGDLTSRDGLVRFIKAGRLLAVATVERDIAALEEECAWENAAGPRSAS
jgi:hypothetical protein